MTPLYAAGETPIEGIDHHALADGIRATGHAAVATVESARDLVPLIRRHARQGDMVVCLGAGLSTEWANALPEWLAEEPRRVGSVA